MPRIRLMFSYPSIHTRKISCVNFIRRFEGCEPQEILPRPRLEALPDDRHSKPVCLFEVTISSGPVGNNLSRVLKLVREWGHDGWVASMLGKLFDANRLIGLCGEGINQAKETPEFMSDSAGFARCSDRLAQLLHDKSIMDDSIPRRRLSFALADSHLEAKGTRSSYPIPPRLLHVQTHVPSANRDYA